VCGVSLIQSIMRVFNENGLPIAILPYAERARLAHFWPLARQEVWFGS
jgi:hypothetical protein